MSDTNRSITPGQDAGELARRGERLVSRIEQDLGHPPGPKIVVESADPISDETMQRLSACLASYTGLPPVVRGPVREDPDS